MGARMKSLRSRSFLVLALLGGALAAACGDGDPSGSADTTGGKAPSSGGSSAGKAGASKGGSGGKAGSENMAGMAGEAEPAAGTGGVPSEGGAGGAGIAGAGVAGEGGTAEAPEARLVIADPDASKLYVYSVPELQQLAVLDDVAFADHAGFVPLDDGRVLFADSATAELVAVQVLGTAEPQVVGRARLATSAVHIAVSPEQDYAAVSGAAALAADQDEFTLVRLSDFFHKSAFIPTGEPGIMLGGEPLYLYHRNDDPAQVEAYAFSQLWSGTVALEGSRAIGAAPHGEALAHAAGKIFVAADGGVNVLPVEGSSFGEVEVIPYDIDGKVGGRAFYARLSTDGNYLYSYLRDSGPTFDWPWKDWVSDAYIVDVKNETAKRLEIGKGLVYRLADSSKFALFVQYHPDGDFAHLLDTNPESPTFQTFVGKIPLEGMTHAPTGEGADPWSSVAFRLAGMVPSGRWGFVSHGGDGKVSVIDTEQMKVVGQVELPTDLNYGGYLLGVEAGTTLRDTIGR